MEVEREQRKPEEQEIQIEHQKAPERVLFDELSFEKQKELLNVALEELRQGIGDVKDYAVFASTAMYLNGEKMLAEGNDAGAELMAPPGDFDAAVFSEQSLKKIRDRMGRMENVTFDNGGKFIEIPGEEMKKLAGKLLLQIEQNNEQKQVEYEFEFFYKSRVVSEELARGRTTEAHGLKVLNLDGLQGQYEKNLQFEGRIEDSVGNIVDYLHADNERAKNFRAELTNYDGEIPLSDEAKRTLEHLDMNAEEMGEVMKLQQEIDKITNEEIVAKKQIEKSEKLRASYESIGLEDKANEQKLLVEKTAKAAREQWKKRQALVSKRAMLLAGTKTKVWKRQLNVLQLARLRGRE